MQYKENAINLLTVRTFAGKGPAWINKNLKGNEDVTSLCRFLETDEENFEKKRNTVTAAITKLGDSIDGIVALGDADFPEFRGKVKDADKPFALFYKGDINLLSKSNLNIAVVGLLNPDEKIEMSERMVTVEILKQGATIVSGLALGCDSIAHKTALENRGKTIAILPSPLNNILPASNKGLAYEIVEAGGLIVTEYYEDFKTTMDLSSRYITRDRLQALFCDSIILAASYAQDSASRWKIFGQKLDCGSRWAMDKAKEYGIKRAVIYNETKHAKNPMYDLNRDILKEASVIRIDSVNMTETITKLLPNKNGSNNNKIQF
jgi:DNA processing protein